MRLGVFGTNRTVYNAKVSLFLRYSKGEDRWSVQKLRLHYENMTVKQRQYYNECLLFDLGTN